ncbi:MAG: carbohydrate ABC transporter permease [Actinobacteria bacterium]|nr:carbohydrate ABC transporter permease [Actinomycetota bacterium]
MSAISTAGPARAGAPPAAPRSSHRRRWLTRPGVYFVALVVVAVTVVPFLYVIVGGFRTTAQLNTNPAGLPHPWVWDNYQAVLTSSFFWRSLGNSAIIAVVATGLSVGLGAMASFALSRYTFPGRDGLFVFFLTGLLFPFNAAVLPLFLLLQRLGMLDNLMGVAIPEAAFSLPFTILILRPFMRAVPGELEDAAVVDGATKPQFFLRVLIPLARPALITVGILAFVTSWNNYLAPLVLLSSQSHFTLPLAVATFQSEYTQNTAAVFAFTALSMVPALAVFVFAQRRLVGALTGALKA